MTDPALKGLDHLLTTPQGREFLSSNGIHADPRAFRAALAPPKDQRLAVAFGTGPGPLVHMHQQIYLDYRASVVGKARVLDFLARSTAAGEQRIAAAFLWIDTDRAASDKLACRFYWPFRGALRAMKITRPGSEKAETRFTRVDPHCTTAAYQRIAGYISQQGDTFGASATEQQLARLSALRSRIVVSEPTMLDDYGLQLTRTVFRAQLGIEGTHLVVSDLLARGLLTSAIEDVLAVLPEFIAGYNARVTDLRSQGIGTAVGLLPPDYLPLYFSDPDDGTRRRLHHEVIAGDHFATAFGGSGQTHRFFLGSGRLRMDAVAATGRWSPDVILPMLANSLFSGWVAGKSSASYALVFNAVLAKVFAATPIPITVPEPDPQPQPEPEPAAAIAGADTVRASSLLHAHITGAVLA